VLSICLKFVNKKPTLKRSDSLKFEAVAHENFGENKSWAAWLGQKRLEMFGILIFIQAVPNKNQVVH